MSIWYNQVFNDMEVIDKYAFMYNLKNEGRSTIANVTSPYHSGEVFNYKTDSIHFLLAVDGEIDNLESLSDKLQISSASSIDVITTLYRLYGYKGLYYLKGAASIILHDITRNTTFLHRLFLKGTPLYFVNKNQRLTVCSNPVYLLHRNDVSDTINEVEIVNILAIRPLEFKDTVFTEIEALEHGELVIIEDHKEVKREKKPLNNIFPKKHLYTNEKSLFKTYRVLLNNAVSDMVIPGKKYGIMLSSGMDSSTIAYFASKEIKKHGGELTAYSWELPEDSADESANIKYLADKLEIPLKLFNGEKFGPFDHLDDIVLLPDTPQVNGYWALMQENYRVAYEDGAEILLSGIYGDQLFRSDRNDLLKDIWTYKRIDIIKEIVKEQGFRGIFRELKIFFKSANHKYTRSMPWLTNKSKDLIKDNKKFVLNKKYKHYTSALSPFVAGHLAKDRYLSGPFNIKRIEPYKNIELMNFSLNVPIHMTFRNNQKKYFLREFMRKLIPEKIRIQPRVGIITTLVEKSFYRNHNKVKEKIWESPSSWNTYVNEEWMQEKLQMNSKVDNNDLYVIWFCITLTAWLKAIKPDGSLYEIS